MTEFNNFNNYYEKTFVNNNAYLNAKVIEREQINFINKVFMWMTLALLVTALTAMYVASSPKLIKFIFQQPIVFFGLIGLEFLLVWSFSSIAKTLSLPTTIFVFFLYSFVNGLTLSIIFLVYTASSIASTFFLTAATFAIMAMYGYFTKTDLTTIGNLAIMTLVGIIIGSIVNFFLQSPTIYWIETYAGVLVFVALIAYDTQRIKEMNVIGNEGTEEDQIEAITGALILYLDFINLFLYLLRIFASRRND